MTYRHATYSPMTMADLLGLLPDCARVLDLGCGGGSFPYDMFPTFTIDALDEFPAPAVPFPAHVRYQQGRAERLPYGERAFDLIISNFVMEHVGDFAAAIDEVARVLKPGGYFYMAIPNARSFEDALYRSIYDGGGHLQRHSFESAVGTIYARTPLKLLSYLEWPAGFTFLLDREALRILTARVIEACRESLGLDIRARSNYLFVFQSGEGLGRRTVAAVCGYCGGEAPADVGGGQGWLCPVCGRQNGTHARQEVDDDRLDADMRALWERYPHLQPSPAEAPPMPDQTPSDDGMAIPPETPAQIPVASEGDLVRRMRLALRMLRRGHI